jgi:hypothetical protein
MQKINLKPSATAGGFNVVKYLYKSLYKLYKAEYNIGKNEN